MISDKLNLLVKFAVSLRYVLTVIRNTALANSQHLLFVNYFRENIIFSSIFAPLIL